MILENTTKQFKFLQECNQNISKTYLSSLTSFSSAVTVARFNNQNFIFKASDTKFADGVLPHSFSYKGTIYDLNTGKLLVFLKIYNSVAEATLANSSIDLSAIFPKIKYELDPILLECIRYDSHYVMTMVASNFPREDPKEEHSFLDNYGFFDTQRNLPLQRAVKNSDVATVTSLLNSLPQSDVNQKDQYGYGQTALTIAAELGNKDIIKLLIKHGAKVDIDCLNAAIVQKHMDAVNLLLNDGSKNDSTFFIRIKIQLDNLIKKQSSHPNLAFFKKMYSFFADYIELKKNARILAQGYRDKSSIFHVLPKEITMQITALTADPNFNQDKLLSEENAITIVNKYFCRPQGNIIT
jgi:hypothetical protein